MASGASNPAAPRRLHTAAWVLYDLANTVYIAAITFVFTPYARTVLGDRIDGVGWANFASMALAALLVPVFGAIADHTGKAHRYLALATIACIAGLIGIGLDVGDGWRPVWLLACFAFANLAYNLGLLFYNALLASVSHADNSGQVSGVGVGVGYLGTILVLAVVLPLDVSAAAKFALAGGIFFVTALPCLALVRERRPPRPGSSGVAVRAALHSLRSTLARLPKDRPLLLFLLGNFCLVDVLNTAVLYFADFTLDTFRSAATDGRLTLLGHTFVGEPGLRSFLQLSGLALNVLALGFGIVLGRYTERAPLGVMRASALALLVALVGGAWFAGRDALGYLATLVTMGAFGLAGIWTAGRKLVLLLAPPERVGEYFGLYGITVKLSVVGAVVFAEVEYAHGTRTAMLAQSAQLLLGLVCLCMVRSPTRNAQAACA